ncbi:MAG: hypothetical protein HZB91_15285 [Elusimicrobia bacterium]|nr:hypothetical protein [Elusimicrobiota bacterium]
MKVTSKRCAYCRRLYRPDSRTRKHQRSCRRPACRRARRRQKQRRWRARNPDYERSRSAKRRVWVKAYPDYYRRYRASHAGYRARDNERRTRGRRRATVSANVTAWRHIIVEKTRKLGVAEKPGMSANVTALSRRVEALEDCLRSTVEAVVSAKQTGIAAGGMLAG